MLPTPSTKSFKMLQKSSCLAAIAIAISASTTRDAEGLKMQALNVNNVRWRQIAMGAPAAAPQVADDVYEEEDERTALLAMLQQGRNAADADAQRKLQQRAKQEASDLAFAAKVQADINAEFAKEESDSVKLARELHAQELYDAIARRPQIILGFLKEFPGCPEGKALEILGRAHWIPEEANALMHAELQRQQLHVQTSPDSPNLLTTMPLYGASTDPLSGPERRTRQIRESQGSRAQGRSAGPRSLRVRRHPWGSRGFPSMRRLAMGRHQVSPAPAARGHVPLMRTLTMHKVSPADPDLE